MMIDIEKAKQVIIQLRQDAIESATYIKTKESKIKYLNKVNYQTGILAKLLEDVQREEKEAKEIEEKEENGDGGQVPPLPIPKTQDTMSIRSLSFGNDKEKGRTESIRRASQYWNF